MNPMQWYCIVVFSILTAIGIGSLWYATGSDKVTKDDNAE